MDDIQGNGNMRLYIDLIILAKLTEDLEVKALFELKTTLVYFTQQRFCLQYILHAYEDEVQHKPNTSA